MTEDISNLLNSIKSNVSKVEEKPSFELLDKIKKDFAVFYKLIKLFLISDSDSYYGNFMINLELEIDFYKDLIAAVSPKDVNLKFICNPLILCKFTLKEIIFIFCHEIEHVILDHCSIHKQLNPNKDEQIRDLFNYAADASVNDRLEKMINDGVRFMRPIQGIIDSKALRKKFPLIYIQENENCLYYYNLIKDYKKPTSFDDVYSNYIESSSLSKEKQNDKDKTKSEINSNNVNDRESEEEKRSEDVDNSKSDNKEDYYENIVTVENFTGKEQHLWQNSGDEEVAYMKSFLRDSYETLNNNQRGLLPSSFEETLNFTLKSSKLDWKRIFKSYVGTVPANRKKSRRVLNRRQPERFDLSGSVIDKVLNIVVAIDTSASVDNKLLNDFFNEIFAIISTRKFKMTIIECDSKIHKVYNVRTKKDVSLDIHGRGGTSFIPVIEYVNNNPQYRNCLLIYFTDGGGDFSIPKPLAYKILWIVPERFLEYFSLEEPYGIVAGFGEE